MTTVPQDKLRLPVPGEAPQPRPDRMAGTLAVRVVRREERAKAAKQDLLKTRAELSRKVTAHRVGSMQHLTCGRFLDVDVCEIHIPAETTGDHKKKLEQQALANNPVVVA